MVLAHGPLDAILNIQVDRRVAWEEHTTQSGPIAVNAPYLFGGDQREGGVSGRVDVLMGESIQLPNYYLIRHLGQEIPAFRGVASLVLNQCYMGNNPYLKPWAVKAVRIQAATGESRQWNPEQAGISRGDITPEDADCVYACDAVQRFFAGHPYANLMWADHPTFQQAFGQTLNTGKYKLFPLGTDYLQDNTLTVEEESLITDCDYPYVWTAQNWGTSTTPVNFHLGLQSDRSPVSVEGAKAHKYHFASIIKNPSSVQSPGHITNVPLGWIIEAHPKIALFYKNRHLSHIVFEDYVHCSLRIMSRKTPTGAQWKFSIPFMIYTNPPARNNPAYARNWAEVEYPGARGTHTVDSEWFDTFEGYDNNFDAWLCLTYDLSVKLEEIPRSAGVKKPFIALVYNYFRVNLYWFNPKTGRVEHKFLHIENGEKGIAAKKVVHSNSFRDWGFYSDLSLLRDKTPVFIGRGVHRMALVHTADTPIDGKALLLAWRRNHRDFKALEGCERCLDMNPAHIIRECLTDTVWGMGYTASDMDEPSFSASAHTLKAEKFGLSILWEKEQPIEDFVGEILRHIDAVLYVSRRTGRFMLKLIRDDADSHVLTLDESDVAEVTDARRPTVSELTNAVTVVYWDYQTDETASLTLHNQALRQVQGVEIGTTQQYPGITHRALAARVAERDLKALSTPLLSCTVRVNRRAARLNIGDVFYLDWPDLGIHSTLMRANRLDYGDGRDGAVTITATQDVFSMPAIPAQASSGGAWTDPAAMAPRSSVHRVVSETPYYTLVADQGARETGHLLTEDPDVGFLLVSAGRRGREFSADVYVDAGAGFNSSATLDFHPWCTVLPVDPVATEWVVLSGLDLDLVTAGTIAQVGEELIRIDAVDTDSTGAYVGLQVGRGILDTTPRRHVGDSHGVVVRFWGEFAVSDDESYAAGESIAVKIQTVQGNAVLALDKTPADRVTFRSRAIRPYPPGDLKIDGLAYPEQYVWSGDHVLTWSHRSRTQQTDAALYDHTAGDIGPEPGVTYRVEGYAYLVDSTDPQQFLRTDVGTLTSWSVDSNFGGLNSNLSGPPPGTRRVVLQVWSQRDGYDSWQPAEIDLDYPGADSVGDSVQFDV